jgi:hypothetical protein
MSTYIIALAMFIWEWLLAPPLRWGMSLSLEWQIEIGLAVLCFKFRHALFEHAIIGREEVADWWADRIFSRDWYYFGSMDEAAFRGLLEAMRKRAYRQQSLADRLEARARGSLWSRLAWKAAARRRARANALFDEMSRLEELRAEIAKEKKDSERTETQRTVLKLMRMLDSDNSANAAKALSELRRVGNSFDWSRLAPPEMSEKQTERLLQFLRLMVGTTSVGEARNAYRSALMLLQQNGWQSHWDTL